MVWAPPPTGLPVEGCVGDVRAALAGVGHAVLRAPPGAGKTTVVPLRLLDEPWLAGARIVVLEPRRLAARAAAARMASLLGQQVGDTVGYRTRDERRVGPRTRVEVVTEGILTRRLQNDPALPGTGLVVFDEVHERNLQTDLALALTLDARAALRPDLRLLAMSATVDTERLAALLGGTGRPAPAVTSEGREHAVDVRWAPPRRGVRPAQGAAAAALRALREQDGDVLVFLAGAADIRRAEAGLTAAGLPVHVDVRPLFGALPPAEQDRALAGSPPGRRRVVLATDIAETSLTVDGVRAVVDTGLARSPRFDPRTGLTRLHTGPVSKASADQRAGRAGRLGPGVAYRLWSQLEHAARRPFAEPEIACVDLAGLALELAVWGAGAADLAFLDPPPARALDEAAALLEMLGAVDTGGRPTASGRAMAELPLHPRLARMVTGALPLGLGWLACVLAALLEDRDVLRGAPDRLPVDVADRVRLLAGPGARHPLLDGPALASARRRATQLAARSGAGAGRRLDLGACGRVLALAYPDRIAQARGGARFRLRNGSGAWVPRPDPLAGEALLVVAELDTDGADSRVRIAAALDPADLEDAAGAGAECSSSVRWDPHRRELRATSTRRLDGLVLASVEAPVEPGPAAAAALLDVARSTSLSALAWTDAARDLQRRAAFARGALGDERVPDLSDTTLLATVDQWLPPLLATAGGRARAALDTVDVTVVLRRLLGHQGLALVAQLAPASVTTASGRELRVDYAGEHPAAAVRVQDLFGTTAHPTVAGGKVPVLLRLLSPAGRVVQVTADLPGFWTGSYAAVRKELAGRYPKHAWPDDPAAAAPPARPGRRR